VRELDSLLSFCKQNHITVVGIVPPFAQAVYEEMLRTGKYKYLAELEPTLRPVFEKYGFEIYFYPSAESCHTYDNAFLDGFHGGEEVYLRILTDMLAKHSVLNRVADKEKLRKDLKNKQNSFIVYPY